MHLQYIKKLYFSHNENSIGRFLTLKVMKKNILWAKALNNICSTYNLRWKSYLNSESEWNDFCTKLLRWLVRS